MRVRLRNLAAGPGGIMPAGSVAEVSEEAGQALVAGGFADEVAAGPGEPTEETAEAEPETATAEPPENAMRRNPRRRKARR